MKRLKRLSVPVLLGVLLIATLVGVAGATPDARPQQQLWRVLTVNSQSCQVAWTYEFIHSSTELRCADPLGGCYFVCPVYFPAAGAQVAGAATVKRVTMYVRDSWAPEFARFELYKNYPPNGTAKLMAEGMSSDLPGIQAVIDRTITNNPVHRTQGPHIYLLLQGGLMLQNVWVSGFYIHYTW